MRKKLVHIILFLGIFSTANAQVYPVQAFVQLTPPYTGYLPDYADPFSEQMKIILTLNDFSVPSYTVKIKLSITGSGFSMQTKSFITLPAIELTPGIPVQITGSELAFYLSSTNLDFTGLSVAQYETKKVLPEGMYSVCVQVLDYYNPSNLVLANNACASAWFTLQSPPLLNTPFCGTQITPTDPQMVLFNWSPLSMSWAGALTSTEYEFSLYEIRPADANPNVVITTTLPIYTTTTSQTFISYGITEPPLQVGMGYVWRIRAIDIGGRDAFLNNGYSQPCTFTYGNIAETIAGNITLNLNANGTGTRQGLANWNAASAFTHYTLEVRKVGGATATWFPYNATAGVLKVNDLEPSTQYEARVKGHNGEFTSEYSNTATFTTLPNPNYACNTTVLPPLENGVQPLQNLIIGNIVSTGQFEMLVTQVGAHPSPGTFSGFGKVNVPFMLLNFNVYFENIFIDENMAMRTGRLVVLTNGVDQWAAGGMDDTYNFAEPDHYVDGDVDSVVLDGNTIIIFIDGTPTTLNYPGGEFTIEDENGDQWTIYADGTIVFHPAVPHIEFTANERKIYILALKQLRDEHSLSVYNQRKNDYLANKTSLENNAQTTVGINYYNADTTNNLEGVLVFEELGTETATNSTEVNNYNTAKKNYFTSKVIRGIAKFNVSSAELDFLGNRALINNLPSYLYVRQNIETVSAEDMVLEVKEAIFEMVSKQVHNY